MTTPKQTPAIPVAVFPMCSECGARKAPAVSDAPLWFQVGEKPPRLIPKCQEAALLRFLWQTHSSVLWADLYQAIGSQEVSRSLARLRKKWGLPIPCARVPKRSKPGTQGAFSLGPNARVWEPEGEEGCHGAG